MSSISRRSTDQDAGIYGLQAGLIHEYKQALIVPAEVAPGSPFVTAKTGQLQLRCYVPTGLRDTLADAAPTETAA